MARITLKGDPVQTFGDLPAVGTTAPDFTLTGSNLSELSLKDVLGGTVILNIFPSLDTQVCAMSVRRFNAEAAGRPGVKVLCISADLPFAHARFCETEGIDNAVNLSSFRSQDFGRDYGVEITTGPLRGLLSRAVVILDKEGFVIYTEQVPEIAQEPDYEAALAALP
ncbi:MAG: thiol peroxidase [Candidatus Aegiribacteria sp.]|nr:thiol peroxidase [Candidatus Aegiribacteria sp.]